MSQYKEEAKPIVVVAQCITGHSIPTSSSAVANKPERRAASRQTAKFLKQSRDHNHTPLVGDMSFCC